MSSFAITKPVKGSVDFYSQDQIKKTTKYILNRPDICLLIDPNDYHWFDNFTEDAIILVLASELFIQSDYIFKKY